jgi:hypothetical protein
VRWAGVGLELEARKVHPNLGDVAGPVAVETAGAHPFQRRESRARTSDPDQVDPGGGEHEATRKITQATAKLQQHGHPLDAWLD